MVGTRRGFYPSKRLMPNRLQARYRSVGNGPWWPESADSDSERGPGRTGDTQRLQSVVGDTIRVSLTPQPGIKRAKEVEICKALLQAMGLRYFRPSVTSCPGCGRTSSDYFQYLARDINTHITRMMPHWKKKFPGVETMKIAVMGCVVNGPGESRHADIGISLPGASEKPVAPVYANGRQVATLKGEAIKDEFVAILEKFINDKYSKAA